MTITLIALGIYFLIVLAFGIFFGFAFDHLWRYGIPGDYSRPVAVISLIISLGVIFITLLIVLISFFGG